MDAIINGLKLLLANTYSLASAAHLAHWNVTGRQFFELHKAFGKLYEELYADADAIAERIRQLGQKSPGGLEELGSIATAKEPPQDTSAEHYATYLYTRCVALIEQGKELRDLCGKENELEVQDLILQLNQARQKNAWMLKSYLE